MYHLVLNYYTCWLITPAKSEVVLIQECNAGIGIVHCEINESKTKYCLKSATAPHPNPSPGRSFLTGRGANSSFNLPLSLTRNE